MKERNFRGGVHPVGGKGLAADKPIQKHVVPETVVIPLQQNQCALAEPLVAKGDQVLLGQLIGKTVQAKSAAVHASVSGEVVSVEQRPNTNGHSVLSVVIKNDGQDKAVEVSGHPDPIQLSGAEILERIAAAGIVGLGGAGFPTAVKLDIPENAKIDYLLINGSECEPYLTADQRIMEECTDDVILGAKLMAKVCGAKKIVIAVEDNKPESIRRLTKQAGSNAIEVVTLATKYPAGGERQLIKSVLNREVPYDARPYQIGVLVQNVGTAWAVARTCLTGMPLIERVVTVSGPGIKEPANFMVRLGTQFKDLVAAAGGYVDEPGKVLAGGPMTGLAQFNLDVPVVKCTAGITVLPEDLVTYQEPLACIKCARCVDVCPAYLLPLRLEAYAMKDMWETADEYGAMDCIECGSCRYICPSKRDLLAWIRLAKHEITDAKQRQTS